MQAEKYIANLEMWGGKGEKEIGRRLNQQCVMIRHPRAILILGRDSELDSKKKKSDFEIIKCKFTHMLDILTYDDLINRLKNAMTQRKDGENQ